MEVNPFFYCHELYLFFEHSINEENNLSHASAESGKFTDEQSIFWLKTFKKLIDASVLYPLL